MRNSRFFLTRKFLARFSTFKNFFKNVLEYQNDSKFNRVLIGNTLQSGLKKNLGVRKSREFLIYRPLLYLYQNCYFTNPSENRISSSSSVDSVLPSSV